jgi:hypothetical protein
VGSDVPSSVLTSHPVFLLELVAGPTVASSGVFVDVPGQQVSRRILFAR